MPRSFRRHPKPEPFWRDLLARWKASGQPVLTFCTRHGVSPASFYAWRRKLAADTSDTNSSPPPAPKFAAVRVVPDATVEVLLPGGLVVRVPTGVDPTAVARLVAALGGGPC
jgi:transposase-like protein